MRKLLSAIVSMALVISAVSVSGFAVESPHSITDASATFTGDNVYLPNVIYVEDGIPRRITQAEYDIITTQKQPAPVDDVGYESRMITFDKFTATSGPYYQLVPELRKACTPMINGGDAGASVSYGEAVSISTTYSISLTSGEITAVLKALGSNVARMASSNKNFGVSFKIPAHTTRRVWFTPRMKTATGNIQRYVQSEGESTARPQGNPKKVKVNAVVKVNGFADGMYECY